MLNPISFLWQQLNGPQITAICQALFNYFKNLCDENLDYLNNLTIANANSDHLSLLGILQGLARPLVPVPDSKMFWFTSPYDYVVGPGIEPEYQFPGHKIPETNYPSEHGLSNGPYGQGGVFDEVPEGTTGYKYIPDYIFRAVLQGNTDSEGQLGGLTALDDILNAIFQAENPGMSPMYTFVWNNDVHSGTPGDIEVDLGTTGDWLHPYEVFAEVKLLGSTVYFPIPRILPKLVEGDGHLDPVGFIHILVMGTEDVYGLNDMWNGTGTPADTEPGEDPEFAVSPITTTELNTMWNDSQSWIDEPSPSYFIPYTPEEIAQLW
jgi:hypothetical protein